MFNIIIGLTFIILSINSNAFLGAPVKLLSEKERSVEYIYEIDLGATDIYGVGVSSILRLLDNKYKQDKVVLLNSETSKNFIANLAVGCDTLKLGNGFARGQFLMAQINFRAKNKKYKIEIRDIKAVADTAWDSGLRPSTTQELKKLENKCIIPIVDKIVASINDSISSDW